MKIGFLILLFLTAAAGQSPGTFTATDNLTENRRFPRATLLPNGKVLITGYGFQVTGAELYDPSTGTFTATGKTGAWDPHSATPLADGRVLIAGGYANKSPGTTATDSQRQVVVGRHYVATFAGDADFQPSGESIVTYSLPTAPAALSRPPLRCRYGATGC